MQLICIFLPHFVTGSTFTSPEDHVYCKLRQTVSFCSGKHSTHTCEWTQHPGEYRFKRAMPSTNMKKTTKKKTYGNTRNTGVVIKRVIESLILETATALSLLS